MGHERSSAASIHERRSACTLSRLFIPAALAMSALPSIASVGWCVPASLTLRFASLLGAVHGNGTHVLRLASQTMTVDSDSTLLEGAVPFRVG